MNILWTFNIRHSFSAQQHIAYMLSALYAIARPSIRHMGGSYKNS